MQPILDLLNRGYSATYWSAGRIVLTALATLFVIGFAFRQPETPIGWDAISSPSKVYTMARAMDDPVGFRSASSRTGDGKFQIAWISGSGTQVIWPQTGGKTEVNEFMPMHVRPKIAKTLGKDVEILLYVLQAGTPIDKYFAIINAMQRDVDLIIYEVNPAYDWGYSIASNRQNLVSSATWFGLKDPQVAVRVLGLSVPVDIVGALVETSLGAIADRWIYNRLLVANAAFKVPAVANQAPPPDPKSKAAIMASASTSWTFWPTFRQLPGFWDGRTNPCGQPNSAGVFPWCSHIDASLAFSRPDVSRGSSLLTVENILFLLRSGRSSIVYLSPVSQKVRREPPLKAQHDAMQARLEAIFKDARPVNSCLKHGYSKNLLDYQAFGDSIHLRVSEPMASEMSKLIIDWVARRECNVL